MARCLAVVVAVAGGAVAVGVAGVVVAGVVVVAAAAGVAGVAAAAAASSFHSYLDVVGGPILGAPDDCVLVAVAAAVGTAIAVAAARAAADGPVAVATVDATVDVAAVAAKTCRHAKGVVLDSYSYSFLEDAAAVAAAVAKRSCLNVYSHT
jgi:hypothetical protein